ncbi:MAG: B12-binding domain-containing radical SAM protein, partial [Proteobacteria bacterium]|nr:B12-binding domain-containing radical SAM protein [Pseudomonadota bacterium]
MTNRSCKVLLVYPRFVPNSFWNYIDTCQLLEARYPAAPLGLITVAALLPQHWEFRLVNRNTQDLSPDDIAWADLVMTGGMMNQQPDCLDVIKLVQASGKPVAVGGPDVTSSPHLYTAADFKVIGEAEGIIGDFVAAWDSGERSGVFEAEKFTADVTQTPIPRFDLLDFNH